MQNSSFKEVMMQDVKKQQDFSPLQNKIEEIFEQKYRDETPTGLRSREEALKLFRKEGFPTQQLEAWRSTDLSSILNDDYYIVSPECRGKVNTESYHCTVKDIDTHEVSVVNGFCFRKELTRLDNGVIYGSLAEAMKEVPELVEQYYGKYVKHFDGFSSLNEALWLDGVFVFVPDNVTLERPIQMLNAYSHDEQLLVSIRNLIVVGKGSALSVLHCDDSLNQQRVLSNTVTEVYMSEYSELNYYKLQNINNKTAIINRMMFHQEELSRLNANQVSLNGGLLRNDIHTRLSGRKADADISGAYLIDKNQFIDNRVYVHHAVSECTSNQELRGVLDDYAETVFNGHILVDKDAQKTVAEQSCRNILVSDKAKIETQPFLEIYADDVKCSHGASVGQLDNEALFYLRSRGISETNARTLLMYAFVAGVLNKIKIEPLKERYADMIKRRLSGELGICGQCVLDCSIKEKMEKLNNLRLF